jgi:SAM-dependent methyltransferase
MQKTCPECAAVFDCRNESHDCWCSFLPAVIPLREGAQCLCPDCLRKKIAIVEAWDAVSEQYARKYQDEILLKPSVQEFIGDFLQGFPESGLLCDMGCGHGQVARFVKNQYGISSCGIDLSPKMIEQARQLNPGIPFEAADMLLMQEKEIYDAVIGLYFIVNFEPGTLPLVFRKLHQLLRPGGKLLLSFHTGKNQRHHEENLWNSGKGLSFFFFDPETVKKALLRSGFAISETRIREPYDGIEYPSNRAYIFAGKE